MFICENDMPGFVHQIIYEISVRNYYMKRIAVIGGGAAGMYAAVAAAKNGCEVHLFEKNEKLGKKIYITGKGRCNLTNACEVEELFDSVCTNRKFLYSAFYECSNQQVINFFEENGTKTKIERGNRVFPVSDKSADVIDALRNAMRRAGVQVHLSTEVQEILTEDFAEKNCSPVSEEKLKERMDTGREKKKQSGKIPLKKICGIRLTDGTDVVADAVLVATGGFSYQTTGSTGDGYRFAQECGHKVTELYPSLVPMNTKETFAKELQGLSLRNVKLSVYDGKKCLYEDFGEMMFTHFGVTGPLVLTATFAKELQGLSLRNVKLSVYDGKKCLYEDFGEMMFTHFGVTGPLVLTASSVVAKKLKEKELQLEIDLKPALTVQQLDARILREFEEAKNKQFKNVIGSLFPAKLTPVMLALSGIAPEKKVNEVSREEREAFVYLIKHLRLTATGLRDYNEAIITKGGVSVKEINPSTMESRQVSGLYFAGEVLDLRLTATGLRDYNEAIITKGGVSVKEINPSTMESRQVSGLYFAGEVLDLDAVTGGFNLQIAWSTGYLAGRAMAER